MVRRHTAFVVDGETGFQHPDEEEEQQAIVNEEMYLDNVRLLDDRRLGEEGQGFYGLMQTFDRSRITLEAAATERAHTPLEYAVGCSPGRRQFGKPMAEHQTVAFPLADMATGVHTARLLGWRAAWMPDAGHKVDKEAPMAKLAASETAMWCRWAAVQTLGGWVQARDYPVKKWMRDAKLEEIEEATSDIQRLVVSGHSFH